MAIRFIIFLSFVFVLPEAISQKNQIDSLYNEFQKSVSMANHDGMRKNGELLKAECNKQNIQIPKELLLWINSYMAFAYSYFDEDIRNLDLYYELQDCSECLTEANLLSYCLFLETVSGSFAKMTHLDKAIEIIDSAISWLSNTQLKDKYVYYSCLQKRAQFLIKKGLFDEAESQYLEVIAIREKDETSKPSDIAFLYKQLASYYLTQNNLESASTSLKRGYNILEGSIDTSSLTFNLILMDYGNIFSLKGNFPVAIKFAKRAADLASEYFSDQVFESYALENLANLYYDMLDHPMFERSFENALDIKKKIYGENHKAYLQSLMHYSLLLKKYNPQRFLEISFKIADGLERSILPDYELLPVLNHLALHYNSVQVRKYDSAFYFIKRGEKKIREAFGCDNELYIHNISMLASVFSNLGKKDSAFFYYSKTNTLAEQLLGRSHALYTSSIRGMAFSLKDQGDLLKAGELLRKWIGISREFVVGQFLSLINNIETNEDLNRSFEEFNGMLRQLHPDDADNLIMAFNNQLLLKGLQLRSWQALKEDLQSNPNLKRIFSNYQDILKRKRNGENVNVLISEVEARLMNESHAFKKIKEAFSLNYKDIQKVMLPTDVVVEFGYFNDVFDSKADLYSYKYFALVMTKESRHPIYIELCFEKQIEELIDRSGGHLSNLYTTGSGESLSSLLIQPILNAFEGKIRIFLAPIGFLNNISFPLIPVSSSKVLGEMFDVHVTSSLTSLLRTIESDEISSMLLVGGVNFGKGNDNDFYWGDLPGAKKEIEYISQIARGNNTKLQILSDIVATKANFIATINDREDSYLLHIASHAYYAESAGGYKTRGVSIKSIKKKGLGGRSNFSLFNCGIVLAGANEDYIDQNSIITGDQIAQLNLSSCRLVVLSACETGVGQNFGSEGIFGLNRAFQLAGVRQVIISNWKVPDDATAELFKYFYSHLFNGESPSRSLFNAQLKMSRKYKDAVNWAAFTLFE